MSSTGNNEPSSSSSNQPEMNFSSHAGMNPMFMPQGLFNVPFMPPYYQPPQFMPFQNMMSQPFNPMMYSMPSQSGPSALKSGSAFTFNPSNFPPFNFMSPLSQNQSRMSASQSTQNFMNQENMHLPGVEITNTSTENSTRDALKPKNIPPASQNASFASTSGCSQMPSYNIEKTSRSSSTQQCSNVSQNAMESSNKRVKSLMENEHEDGAAWSKTKSQTKQKELETPVPMDVDSSFLLRKEGGRGEHETMRIILGTVEDVLKWSSAEKSLSPSEILIQCIGVFIKVLKSDTYQTLLLVRGLKPNSPSLQVVFYPFDRSLPPVSPNQIVLCTGCLKGSRNFQAYDLEILDGCSPSKLETDLRRVLLFSNQVVQDFQDTR
ncbi:unnamed protein product [Bemisia tabaci]|uniref:Uncharacterized protein n=1 Tax=Bemisia tabaci TaxID=7038 RepID=A0A9P0G5L1_BEMTA|nr:unnamed protein product [Bemisia tabaci]